MGGALRQTNGKSTKSLRKLFDRSYISDLTYILASAKRLATLFAIQSYPELLKERTSTT